jgi:SAM-dependent methyltransferase
VDRNSRADLAFRFRSWCPTEGLRPGDLADPALPGIKDFLPPRRPRFWYRWPLKLGKALRRAANKGPAPPPGRGKVTIYNQDLADMPDLPDDSVEAVVSISALEHNDPDSLRSILRELMRVLRPGGMLVATLPAARDHDWFHQPSRAWCYTEASLRGIFELSPDAPSNYDRYDDYFEALQECDQLRLSLADSYFKSGDNGMPWGVWAPRYQPVGVVKVKKYE